MAVEEQWKSSLSFLPGETYWTLSLLRFSMIIMVKISPSSWLLDIFLSQLVSCIHTGTFLTQYPLMRSQSSTSFLTKFDFKKKESGVEQQQFGMDTQEPNWCLWYSQWKKKEKRRSLLMATSVNEMSGAEERGLRWAEGCLNPCAVWLIDADILC